MCNYFQFNASTTKLMSSYLDTRYQSVKTNGVISTSRPIQAGVPQGVVPLLFIVFVNGITYQAHIRIISINLRSMSVSNYQVPRINKYVGQRSLNYLEPRTYNDLPNSARVSTTLGMFNFM